MSDNGKRIPVEYNLPPSTSDPAALEQLRRGLCQQADGIRQQLQGVHQQIRAIDKLIQSERTET